MEIKLNEKELEKLLIEFGLKVDSDAYWILNGAREFLRGKRLYPRCEHTETKPYDRADGTPNPGVFMCQNCGRFVDGNRERLRN